MMSNERICFHIFHLSLVFINLQKKHLNLFHRFILNKQGSMSLFDISRDMPNYFCIFGTLETTVDVLCLYQQRGGHNLVSVRRSYYHRGMLLPLKLKEEKMYILDAVTLSGILNAKQKVGVTFNFVIDLTKFSKMTISRASETNSEKQSQILCFFGKKL